MKLYYFSDLQEVDRVLKMCGRYIIVSLLQEHILQAILNFFCPLGWLIRISRCPEAENKEGASSGLAVFVVVCTKIKMPGSQSVSSPSHFAVIDYAPMEVETSGVLALKFSFPGLRI